MSNNSSVGILIGAIDNFTKPIEGINRSTQKFRQNIIDLNKKASQISGFKNLERQLGETASSLGEARKKLSSLGKEIKATESPTRQLKNDFESAKRSVLKLDNAHKRQLETLRKSRNGLKETGLDVKNLSNEEEKLNQKLDKKWRLLGKINKRQQTLKNLSDKLEKASSRAANFSLIGHAGSQVSRSIFGRGKNLVESVRDLDIAKGELASVGVKNIDAVVNAGRELSKRLAGVTTASFVAASYDIKSGIASLTDEGVAEMTKAAVITSKATKATQAEMTSLFATGYGIFKRQYAGESDKGFGGLFSAAIAKSVQQFKTTGSGMQQAIQSMGAGATNLGMTLADQLTVLGQLQAVMPAGEAGTSMRSFAQNAAKANKEFEKLSRNGKNPVRINLLDELGMLRAMPDILSDIKKRYGETLNAMDLAEIQKAFGSEEAVKVINNLYGQEAAFRSNSSAINDAQKAGLSFTESMASLVDNTPTARLDMLNQRLNLLKENIGEKLLTIFDKYHLKIGTGIESIGKWIEGNKKLIIGGVVLAAVIGGLAAMLVPLALGAALLNGALAVFRGLILTISVLSTPLGLKMLAIVAVVGALAVAAGLVMKNWEPITNFFHNIASDIKSIFASIVLTVLESMQSVISVMPTWALPESLEKNNIGSTISRYKAMARGGAYKPVSFSGFDIPGSIGGALGLDQLVGMFATESVSNNAANGKTQNNEFKFEAPITINAAPGMNPGDIAKQARAEFEKMLEQMQNKMNLAAHY